MFMVVFNLILEVAWSILFLKNYIQEVYLTTVI